MRSETELADTIRAAMHRKKLKEADVAKMLDISRVMLEKLLCGDVVPSSHLQKQMKEVLGISVPRVTRISSRRQQKAKNRQVHEERHRKAA